MSLKLLVTGASVWLHRQIFQSENGSLRKQDSTSEDVVFSRRLAKTSRGGKPVP